MCFLCAESMTKSCPTACRGPSLPEPSQKVKAARRVFLKTTPGSKAAQRAWNAYGRATLAETEEGKSMPIT